MRLLKKVSKQLAELFSGFDKPQTYGSALEAYIVSHNPQDGCDIDRLQRQFDQAQARRNSAGWVI
jgi:hypothetical protein